MAGPLAAARDADDDPRAVVRARGDGPGAAGVLRVPLGADGAVGRPGVDRVHRRHGDRRRARPKRPAAVALLRDARTAWSSWRRRSACSTFRPKTSSLKERLHPGRIFLVDTAQGRIVSDEEIKRDLAAAHPYERWLRENLVDIDNLPEPPYLPRPSHEAVLQRQHMFGYTQEDLRLLLAPMATDGEEPIGSMGTDTRAGGALGSAASALRLLQADVRAGHQPAARRDPRGAGDDDGVDGRAGRQPARPAARVVPADPDQVSGDRQRAAGAAAPRLPAGLPIDDDPDAVRSRAGRRRPRARDGGAEAAGQRRGRGRLHDSHPVGSQRRSRRARRSRACSRPRGCTIISSARAPGRGAVSSSSPATRGRCITARCCSATAPEWSTRTSRSRRSPT